MDKQGKTVIQQQLNKEIREFKIWTLKIIPEKFEKGWNDWYNHCRWGY